MQLNIQSHSSLILERHNYDCQCGLHAGERDAKKDISHETFRKRIRCEHFSTKLTRHMILSVGTMIDYNV